MSGFASNEYTVCKQWIAQKIQDGRSWEDVKNLCVTPQLFLQEFDRLQNDDLIIPRNMAPDDWAALVDEYSSSLFPVVELYGISAGSSNSLPVPTDRGSAWARYKNYLLGKYDGKQKMSESAVDLVERNSHWILNHMRRDTRASGPIKGLVMGSVQSGKTANMIGLVSMAASYDWNVFIVLSGTIDNLRKQTRDRFSNDLLKSGGVSWHILDRTSKPEYLLDINEGDKYISDDLALNTYQDGKTSGNWMHRYVTVCLKNSTRLRNLINWLHANPARAAKMRILIIDDEADQASINTRKMSADISDEEEIERTAVNQLIIDLANGKEADGSVSKAPFQAINYISFTATPYANVLNEAYETSLYPKDFICSLPESDEYFGCKAIFGSKTDDDFPGMDVVRDIPPSEMRALRELHSGKAFTLPTEFRKSVCWFLCSAAILRLRKHKKPISMLIHTTGIQSSHFEEYDVLRNWLIRERTTGSIMELCKEVYEEEKGRFSLNDLKESYSKYARIGEVADGFPDFSELTGEIQELLSDINNIKFDDDKQLTYSESCIHLCVDNCRANRIAEEGINLRIVYPGSEELEKMRKAPVFIVMGGNTLSRGLTVEGLTCTYFARNSNMADTLMQMARWFGYKRGYELLQRVWMPPAIKNKFELLEEIDEKLKAEFEDFMEKGRSPAQFGPRVTNAAVIAKFMVTSKNKSQNAEACNFDFSGDSYETTKFEDTPELERNIARAETFLSNLGLAAKSQVVDSAYVWRDVDSSVIVDGFLKIFSISECSSLFSDIPIFITWLKKMNDERHYLRWNVAIAGDGGAESKWTIGDATVGTIERSKKKNKDYIDIGSLRSGRDALCDVDVERLSAEKKKLLADTMKSGKRILSVRGDLELNDTPLLLLYRIGKNCGKESKTREKINSSSDIIGFSIVVAGDPAGASYVTAIKVKIPEQE